MSETEPSATQKTVSKASALVDFSGSSDEELDETPPEFYDAQMDDRDQAWVERKRKGRKSDALLSCPACFTTLCIDCQRHEKIVTQYRAMFVLNCKIVEGKSQGIKDRKRKRKTKNSAQSGSSNANMADNIFRPVSCSVCGTEVAVIDKEEVYHFYNVLPSFV
ncbi:hypothetical protein KP509_18G066300 [Ceratopteris richardii]|uniref:E2F-associated phosphoprotein n=2 Tax=Ceratopteris richardii TaxID=49495 RepID=A0A8T2SR56_CERRI|nr:hypothetical protein KP509_18G066300 [Ceratopteris richardii]